MHDNPDVSRFVVRVDSFDYDNEPGRSPSAHMIAEILLQGLLRAVTIKDGSRSLTFPDIHVEVEERLA